MKSQYIGGLLGVCVGFLDKTKDILLGPQAFRTNVLTCAPTFRRHAKTLNAVGYYENPNIWGAFLGAPWGVSDKTKDFSLGPRAFRTNVLTCAPIFCFCAPNPNYGGL